MVDKQKTEERVEDELTLATDGRGVADFENLEQRRINLSERFGRRAFSRQVVGDRMGVPGPTVQRIERVTPKTTAVELENLEIALDELEKEAADRAEAEAEAKAAEKAADEADEA